jgi:hypothetical protein
MDAKGAIEFWQTGNRWRFIAYPILYVAVAIIWRNFFSPLSEAPLHVLSLLGGGQCLLLANMPERVGFAIFCAAMLIALVVEITAPSEIHGRTPTYTDRQRVGYGLLHAFAWTGFALGIEKLFVILVCKP